MAAATLLTCKLQELHYNNAIEKPGQFQIENSFSFHVEYNRENSRCVAKLYQSAREKSEDSRFFISVDMIGVFELEDVSTPEDKKEIHVQCYYQLFPYAQQLVSQLCAGSGLANFKLRRSKMSPDNVTMNTRDGGGSKQI